MGEARFGELASLDLPKFSVPGHLFDQKVTDLSKRSGFIEKISIVYFKSVS